LIAAPHRSTVQYPGGLSARYRWGGTGQAESVFSLSEVGGRLDDHGTLVSPEPDRLCRAELRVEGPVGAWTARFASPIFDEPQGLLWDVPSLLVVKYGFLVYALDARSGELRWTFASGTPITSVLGAPRLPHVIAQSEVETAALQEDGSVAWRVAHSDVVVEAALVGGQVVLTSYGGATQTLDPLSGRSAG
jgi:outer membrane protein assembly factor BamB